MKSLIEEASSIVRAIEKAWVRAGSPQYFSVKILEKPKKNFLGLTQRSAKVSIFFDVKELAPNTLERSGNVPHINRPRSDQRRPKKTQGRSGNNNRHQGGERNNERRDNRKRFSREDRKEEFHSNKKENNRIHSDPAQQLSITPEKTVQQSHKNTAQEKEQEKGSQKNPLRVSNRRYAPNNKK